MSLSPVRNLNLRVIEYDSLPKHPALLSNSLVVRDRPPTPRNPGRRIPGNNPYIRSEKPVKIPSLDSTTAPVSRIPVSFSLYPVLPPVNTSGKSSSLVEGERTFIDVRSVTPSPEELKQQREYSNELRSLGGRDLNVYAMDSSNIDSKTRYVHLPAIQTNSGLRNAEKSGN